MMGYYSSLHPSMWGFNGGHPHAHHHKTAAMYNSYYPKDIKTEVHNNNNIETASHLDYSQQQQQQILEQQQQPITEYEDNSKTSPPPPASSVTPPASSSTSSCSAAASSASSLTPPASSSTVYPYFASPTDIYGSYGFGKAASSQPGQPGGSARPKAKPKTNAGERHAHTDSHGKSWCYLTSFTTFICSLLRLCY